MVRIRLAKLLLKRLGIDEDEILSGKKAIFNFAMFMDEVEEIIEQKDVSIIISLNGHIENMSKFLSDFEDIYMKARNAYQYHKRITKDIDRQFLNGLQYIFCYLTDRKINRTNRTAAAAYFLTDTSGHFVAGYLLLAYAIGLEEKELKAAIE